MTRAHAGTVAVIGSVGHCDDTLHPLIRSLDADFIPVIVVDNRGTLDKQALREATVGCSLTVWDAPGRNIHQVWNAGMNHAAKFGAGWAAILNDDIIYERGSILRALQMVEAGSPETDDIALLGLDWELHAEQRLRTVTGSYREHGLGGFAFLVRLDTGLRYDERFVWWGGDDDLIWRAGAAGMRAVVADGCWVDHPPGGNTSGRHHPELMAATGGDRQLLLDKWGKTW